MNKKKNIVTVGGGTGSFTVLSGLKDIPQISLSALASMADDGGSTGVLRDELGVLPPGDVRQCLVALSEHTEIVRKLMNYRFENGGLTGHSFGNVFLAALEKVTGSFAGGVEVASEILKVKGKVIPVTKNKATLALKFTNGKIVEGEDNIQNENLQDSGAIEKIYYKDPVSLSKNAKDAILKADYIVIGPGNYFCSLVPILIINGFKEIILKSKAKIILPINLTNKIHHTVGWKTSDYLKNIEMYLSKPVDIVLLNNKKPSKEQVELYKLSQGNIWIEDDLKDERVVRDDLLSKSSVTYSPADRLQNHRSFIRHDSKKLAKCIEKIINQ